MSDESGDIEIECPTCGSLCCSLGDGEYEAIEREDPVPDGPDPRISELKAEVARLRDLLRPFANAAKAHGVTLGKDDLWVSLGVPGSAWVVAGKADLGESCGPQDERPKDDGG